MNLAIEYMIRNKLVEGMLSLPCSVFLKDINDTIKTIVTIQNSFGKPTELSIKQWHLDKIQKNRPFPLCSEFVCKKKYLFNNSYIILTNHYLMEYEANPYRENIRQVSDEPYATIQSRNYKTCMDEFFNSPKHNLKRYTILWNIFITSFFPKTGKSDFKNLTITTQQEMVNAVSPFILTIWNKWAKYMLIDTPGIASELAFAPAYAEKLENAKKLYWKELF